MPRITKEFTKTEYGRTFTSTAYTDDGKVWKWDTNDRPVPLDAAKSYGIPIDPEAQKAAEDAYVDAFITEYRDARKNYQPSAEEQYEMRAAFGSGKDIVDVITGQRFKT
jgi:hypothetical protein